MDTRNKINDGLMSGDTLDDGLHSQLRVSIEQATDKREIMVAKAFLDGEVQQRLDEYANEVSDQVARGEMAFTDEENQKAVKIRHYLNELCSAIELFKIKVRHYHSLYSHEVNPLQLIVVTDAVNEILPVLLCSSGIVRNDLFFFRKELLRTPQDEGLSEISSDFVDTVDVFFSAIDGFINSTDKLDAKVKAVDVLAKPLINSTENLNAKVKALDVLAKPFQDWLDQLDYLRYRTHPRFAALDTITQTRFLKFLSRVRRFVGCLKFEEAQMAFKFLNKSAYKKNVNIISFYEEKLKIGNDHSQDTRQHCDAFATKKMISSLEDIMLNCLNDNISDAGGWLQALSNVLPNVEQTPGSMTGAWQSFMLSEWNVKFAKLMAVFKEDLQVIAQDNNIQPNDFLFMASIEEDIKRKIATQWQEQAVKAVRQRGKSLSLPPTSPRRAEEHVAVSLSHSANSTENFVASQVSMPVRASQSGSLAASVVTSPVVTASPNVSSHDGDRVTSSGYRRYQPIRSPNDPNIGVQALRYRVAKLDRRKKIIIAVVITASIVLLTGIALALCLIFPAIPAAVGAIFLTAKVIATAAGVAKAAAIGTGVLLAAPAGTAALVLIPVLLVKIYAKSLWSKFTGLFSSENNKEVVAKAQHEAEASITALQRSPSSPIVVPAPSSQQPLTSGVAGGSTLAVLRKATQNSPTQVDRNQTEIRQMEETRLRVREDVRGKREDAQKRASSSWTYDSTWYGRITGSTASLPGIESARSALQALVSDSASVPHLSSGPMK